MRIDFAGGWTDVPKFSRPDSFIVNCTISPTVSLSHWGYEIGSGLGGSAAYAILTGKNGIESELNLGVGWQDPVSIMETGLCVWKSGHIPELDFKINPIFLSHKLALLWTGKSHVTYTNIENIRNYNKIAKAGRLAREAVNPLNPSYDKLCEAVKLSYEVQLNEGMKNLPSFHEKAKKYCGGGFGGYALYLFEQKKDRDLFLKRPNTKVIEPYID